MKKSLRSGLIVLSLAGIAVSIYLTTFHFRILSDPNFESICKISETFNCDKVNTSAYAKVWGIPLGMYGAAFYLVIATLAGLSFSSREKLAPALELIFGLSVLAVLASAVLAYVSKFIIGAWCLFCISLYVINLGLLFLSYIGAEGGLRSIIGRLDRLLAGFYRSPLIYASVLIFLGVSLLGGGFYKAKAKEARQAAVNDFVSKKLGKEKDEKVPKAELQPGQGLQGDAVSLKYQGHEPIRGNPNAPVSLVLFSDFECPYCQRASFVLDEVFQENRDIMNMTYKQYPLDDSCNPYMKHAMHPYACAASIASICAKRQGRFWEMHDTMFRNQSDLTDAHLERYAKDIGLNMQAFKACLEDRDVILNIARDIDQGKSVPIHGTPSIFINGRQWKGPLLADALSQVIQELAAKPKKEDVEADSDKAEAAAADTASEEKTVAGTNKTEEKE